MRSLDFKTIMELMKLFLTYTSDIDECSSQKFSYQKNACYESVTNNYTNQLYAVSPIKNKIGFLVFRDLYLLKFRCRKDAKFYKDIFINGHSVEDHNALYTSFASNSRVFLEGRIAVLGRSPFALHTSEYVNLKKLEEELANIDKTEARQKKTMLDFILKYRYACATWSLK